MTSNTKLVEKTGDIFKLSSDDYDVMVITTNGYVKGNGEAVMGRGCALQAKKLYPDLPRQLGKAILKWGNRVYYFKQYNLLTFPVKPRYCNDNGLMEYKNIPIWVTDQNKIPGYICKAKLDIIKESMESLLVIQCRYGWKKIIMPRPGCGHGELDWSVVSMTLADVIDNTDLYHFYTF